jgi:hypothetical protein
VAIFGEALTGEQITYIYNGGAGRNLVPPAPGQPTWSSATINGHVYDTVHFAGDSYLSASAAGLPSGSEPRTIAGWFASSRGRNGPFGYGIEGENNAFYINVRCSDECPLGDVLHLDVWGMEEGFGALLPDGMILPAGRYESLVLASHDHPAQLPHYLWECLSCNMA